MKPMTRSEFVATAGLIRSTLAQLEASYPFLASSAYSPRKSGETVAVSHSSSDVGDLMLSTSRQRKLLNEASKNLLVSLSNLNKLEALLDDRLPVETDQNERFRQRPATQIEVARARKHIEKVRDGKLGSSRKLPWKDDEIYG